MAKKVVLIAWFILLSFSSAAAEKSLFPVVLSTAGEQSPGGNRQEEEPEGIFDILFPPLWYKTALFHIFFVLTLLLIFTTAGRKIHRRFTKHLHKRAVELERKVQMRTQELKSTQEQLVQAAHKAGRAEIAAEILHSAGNLLNSISIASEKVNATLSHSFLNQLLEANKVVREYQGKPEDFISRDPRGKAILPFYQEVGRLLEKEHLEMKNSMGELDGQLKQLIAILQSQRHYIYAGFINQAVDLIALVEDTTRLYAPELLKKNISLFKNYPPVKKLIIDGDRSRILHTLLSLYDNAIESFSREQKKKEITITIQTTDNGYSLEIADNGRGIPRENLQKIFSLGYTTKPVSTGYSLHICANFMTEMKGKISAFSEGENKGARFLLEWQRKEHE